MASASSSVVNSLFDSIYSELDIEVPLYLKTLLKYNGFDNLYSLSQLSCDKDVNIMETYAKDVLSKVLQDPEKHELFGIFFEECSLFKIPEGHKIILDLIKDEACKKLKKRCREKDPESSAEVPTKKNKKIKESASETNAETNIDYGTVPAINLAVEHVKNISQAYIDKFSREELQKKNISQEKFDELLEKSKTLIVEMNGSMSAKIVCPLCTFKSSAYSVKNSKSGQKWVVSNFLRHYRTHFKQQKQAKCNVQTEALTQKKISKPYGLLNFVTTKAMVHSQIETNKTNLSASVISINTTDENQETVCLSSSSSQSDLKNSREYLTEKKSVQVEQISEQTENIISNNTDQPSNEVLQLDSDSMSEFFPHGSSVVEASTSASKILNPPKCKILSHDTNSRRERNLRVLHELPFNQIQITTFMDQISNAIDQNPEITNTLKILTENKVINKQNFDTRGLLKHLLESAIKNSENKTAHSNKFNEGMKRFWLYIFITAGRMAYEVLYSNLKNILPSITTLNRQLEQTDNITEGVVRFKDLKLYLEKRSYPFIIFVSEDQTALIKRIQYDPASNSMIGFVTPLSQETGFPSGKKFIVDSVADIEDAFKTETMAINAYVFMAQPLVDGAPGFCIAIFGSDNRFTFTDVSRRWQHLQKEAAKHGIIILGFSSDGDPRCLKSMKIMSKLPSNSGNPYEPYFQAEYNLEMPTVFQDTVHISTKLKTRLLNFKIVMKMGDKSISVDHIRTVIKNYTRDKHLLCESHLQCSDKMNFDAIDKMSSQLVTDLLKHIPDAEATRQYLILTRCILDAFLSKELAIERRVYLIWYATFFCRVWKYWLSKNSSRTQKNFITSNTYSCIELNAHGMLLVIEKLRQKDIFQVFTPWLFSSQPCEKIFRETRAMSSIFSTMVNYSLLEILRRLRRIQALNEISTDLGPEFNFPREQNHKLGSYSAIPEPSEIPSVKVIRDAIEQAQEDAWTTAREMGMEIDSKDRFQNVDLPVAYNDLETDDDIEINSNKQLSPDKATSELLSESDLPKDDAQFVAHVSTISNCDSLILKDYSEKKHLDKSCLAVKLHNGKILVIKKSTLCWFFSNRQGRLSSDRILRVRGMIQNKPKRNIIIAKKNQLQTKKKRQLKYSSSESESESRSEYSLGSDTLSEDFSDLEETHNDNIGKGSDKASVDIIEDLKIELESYYAIYYDTQWYIGRTINKISDKYKVKFLQKDLDTFKWPPKDDIQEVHKDFIFYGPIILLGTNPFSLKRVDLLNVQKKYKGLKKLS